MYPGAQPQLAKVLTTSFAAQSLTSTSKQGTFQPREVANEIQKKIGKSSKRNNNKYKKIR